MSNTFPLQLEQIFEKLKSAQVAHIFEVLSNQGPNQFVCELTNRDTGDHYVYIFQMDTANDISVAIGHRHDDEFVKVSDTVNLSVTQYIRNVNLLLDNVPFLKASLPSTVSDDTADLLFTFQCLVAASISNLEINTRSQLIGLEVVVDLIHMYKFYEKSIQLQRTAYIAATHELNGTTPTMDDLLSGDFLVQDKDGNNRFLPVNGTVDTNDPIVQACVGVYEQFVNTYTNFVNVGNMLTEGGSVNLELLWTLIFDKFDRAVRAE